MLSTSFHSKNFLWIYVVRTIKQSEKQKDLDTKFKRSAPAGDMHATLYVLFIFLVKLQ